MRDSLISIITPTYNHEKYIGQCIESVIKQTYDNWEMIIIDDCSTDDTLRIINKFAQKDTRIKLIRHKKNWGIGRLKDTYNQGLRLSKGKLIAILEGDDFWPKDKLKTQIKAFEDKDVVLSYGNWKFVSNNGVPIYTRKFSQFSTKKLNNDSPPIILDLFLTLQLPIISSTVILKKEVLKKIKGFQNNTYYPFVDIPTYLHSSLYGKFRYFNKVLGYYRRSYNSSWLSFIKRSSTAGKESIRNCVNNFIYQHYQRLNNYISWEHIKKSQLSYLKKRKVLNFISIFFNKIVSKL